MYEESTGSIARIIRSLAAAVVASWLAATAAPAAQCDCAQPITGGAAPSATDCLKILNVAVGIGDCSPCDPCVCRPNGGAASTATDALLCLAAAVGQNVTMRCPCGGTTTTTTTLIPRNVAGDWTLTASELDNDCGEALEPPVMVPITLSPNGAGDVTLVSPTPAQLGLSAFQAAVSGAQLVISFYEAGGGERVCYQGALDIDETSSAFAGPLLWKYVGSSGTPCTSAEICGGTDYWDAERD